MGRLLARLLIRKKVRTLIRGSCAYDVPLHLCIFFCFFLCSKLQRANGLRELQQLRRSSEPTPNLYSGCAKLFLTLSAALLNPILQVLPCSVQACAGDLELPACPAVNRKIPWVLGAALSDLSSIPAFSSKETHRHASVFKYIMPLEGKSVMFY